MSIAKSIDYHLLYWANVKRLYLGVRFAPDKPYLVLDGELVVKLRILSMS